jgi:hypothetical protein
MGHGKFEAGGGEQSRSFDSAEKRVAQDDNSVVDGNSVVDDNSVVWGAKTKSKSNGKSKGKNKRGSFDLAARKDALLRSG